MDESITTDAKGFENFLYKGGMWHDSAYVLEKALKDSAGIIRFHDYGGLSPEILISGTYQVTGKKKKDKIEKTIFNEKELDAKKAELQEFIKKQADLKRNVIIISLPDLHGAVFMYNCFEELIRDAVDYVNGKHENNDKKLGIRVIVAIPGDIASRNKSQFNYYRNKIKEYNEKISKIDGEITKMTKSANKDETVDIEYQKKLEKKKEELKKSKQCLEEYKERLAKQEEVKDVFLDSKRLHKFLSGISKKVEVCFYAPGNHDTQGIDDWKGFIEKSKALFEREGEHTFYSMSNLVGPDGKAPFKSAEENVFTSHKILGNTLFFPYGMNYGLTGTAAIADDEILDALGCVGCYTGEYEKGFFQDFHRRGLPDVLLDGNTGTKLNLIAERTMDNFVAAMNELAATHSEGPLNVVFVAHDSPFRLAIFLELMSKYNKKKGHRLPQEVLERLHFYIASWHEHLRYTLSDYIYMTAREGSIVKIPYDAVGAGIFGQGVGLLGLNIEDPTE